MYKVDNAIILAAGLSSRFAPISYEKPKGLVEVKGEVLIERQINQLKEAGINNIIVVVGYMKEAFDYLKEKYDVILIENQEYLSRNNNASIFAAKDYLKNSYICSCDNYFLFNPFEKEVEESYYAAIYEKGDTCEWCIESNDEDIITNVKIGGSNSWVMMGHTFWSEEFSKLFIGILEKEYYKEETKTKFWENIYIENIDILNMKIKKYPSEYIYEFDSLDELRKFDNSYYLDSKSRIIKNISEMLCCKESEIINIAPKTNSNLETVGFIFSRKENKYQFLYDTGELKLCID